VKKAGKEPGSEVEEPRERAWLGGLKKHSLMKPAFRKGGSLWLQFACLRGNVAGNQKRVREKKRRKVITLIGGKGKSLEERVRPVAPRGRRIKEGDSTAIGDVLSYRPKEKDEGKERGYS